MEKEKENWIKGGMEIKCKHVKMYNLTNLSFNEHRVIYVMNKLPKNIYRMNL